MYKKIMVAIDDDEISRNALQEAAHIAAKDGAKLCVVHVAARGGNDDENRNSNQAGAELLRRAKSTAGTAPEVETRLLEAEGEYGRKGVSEAIANAVIEGEADLLVVGTQGRRGLERLVIGSVAEHLVDTVDISILIVRSHGASS